MGPIHIPIPAVWEIVILKAKVQDLRTTIFGGYRIVIGFKPASKRFAEQYTQQEAKSFKLRLNRKIYRRMVKEDWVGKDLRVKVALIDPYYRMLTRERIGLHVIGGLFD